MYYSRTEKMFDTIRGYLEIKPMHRQRLGDLIENSIVTKLDNGFRATTHVDNFKVIVRLDSNGNPFKLSFYGSLTKLYYGNNIQYLNRRDTLHAINLLSKKIGVPIKGAVLTRVDFGLNVELDYPVHQYTNSILSYPRMEWMRLSSSVTFFTRYGSKSLIFYDKIKETKNNSKETYFLLSRDSRNKNVIRYELRFSKRIKNRFDVEQLKVRHLYKKRIRDEAKRHLLVNYNKVVKSSFGKNPTHLLNVHNGGLRFLSYHGIKAMGYNHFEQIISQFNFGTKNDSSKRSKMKSTIKDIILIANENSLDSDLIGELDQKIYQLTSV